MLKRLSTLLLAFAFVTTASASTVGAHSINAAIDEFNFAVTVEWDQQDQAFYQAQMKKFLANLNTLRAQGATTAEIIDVAVSTVKNEKLAQEMKSILELIEVEKLSVEEAQGMLLEATKNNSSTGASWSSDAWVWIGPVLGIAVLLALLSGGSSSGSTTTDPGTNPGYTCGYNYSCYWGYDSWGYYGYQCGYVYSCGWF